MWSVALPMLLAGWALRAPAPGGTGESESDNPWVLAGAQTWPSCAELTRQALAQDERNGAKPPATRSKNWRRRVARCPGDPELLVLAAAQELALSARLDDLIDTGASAAPLVARHHRRMTLILHWLTRAESESQLRDEPPPPRLQSLRAQTLINLQRIAQARSSLDASVLDEPLAQWHTDRLAAIAALVAGDLQLALKRAHQAVDRSAIDQAAASSYIEALILDRAELFDQARDRLNELRASPSHTTARLYVMGLLPIHERIYLRALDHQAQGNVSAALQLWDAYLALPNIPEPERLLAQRHRDQLMPHPPPVLSTESAPYPDNSARARSHTASTPGWAIRRSTVKA